MRRKQAWTEEQCERLRQHVATGGSVFRASAMFGLSVSGLRTKARELGCPFPSLREERAKRKDAEARP